MNFLTKTWNFLTKTWKWLDKKKTTIGTVSLLTAELFPQHTLTHQILSIVGTLFGGVGIIHKTVKKDFGLSKLSGGK